MDTQEGTVEWDGFSDGFEADSYSFGACFTLCSHISVRWLMPFDQMPYVLAFSLFMILAGFSLPRTSSTFRFGTSATPIISSYFVSSLTARSLLYFNVIWLTFALLSLVYILGHGIEYVAWPRLNPPTDFLFYDGPGYKSGAKGRGFKIPFNLDKRLVKGGVRTGGRYTNANGGLLHRHSKTEEIEMGMVRKSE